MGDTEGYGSASTPDGVTEKAVNQPGSDSEDGVWRDRQHRHWERSATGMYPLTTTVQYIRRKHNERGFGRMGEWNQRRGRIVTNLRYADDTTLLAGTKEDLTELVERVRRASEKAGLYLNVGKTKVMTTGDIGEVTVDGKDIEVVTKKNFLGALITKDGLCEKEVRRRIAMGKAAMGGLTSIWKDRGVTMETKVKLVKVLGFPIVLYGAETWTLRKHERRKIDAFELWCWRRVLRVSWMERKTNIWIIENIKPEWTLESRVPKAALSYFGHVVRAGGMEDDVMLGRMNGARRRGRPRQRWLDTLMGYSSGATISTMRRYARDRAGWRGAATAIARSRMRLDGTR